MSEATDIAVPCAVFVSTATGDITARGDAFQVFQIGFGVVTAIG